MTKPLTGSIGEIHQLVEGGNSVFAFTLVKAGTEYPVEGREFYAALFVVRGTGPALGITATVITELMLKAAKLSEETPVTIEVDFDMRVPVGREPSYLLRLGVTKITVGRSEDHEIRTA